MFNAVLYAIIGTIWIVSLVGILHLASYVYHTIKEEPQQSPANEYFWDFPRVVVSFFLALAIFYAGMARRVAALPDAVALQVVVRPPVWPADIWLMMSLFCLGLAMLSALVSINWSYVSTATSPLQSQGGVVPAAPQLLEQRQEHQQHGGRRQTQALTVWEFTPIQDSPRARRALTDSQHDPDREAASLPALPGPVQKDATVYSPTSENPLQRSLQMLPQRLRFTSGEKAPNVQPYDIALGEEGRPQLTGLDSATLAPVLQLPRVVRSYPLRRARRLLVSSALVCLFLIVGWQLVARLDVLGALGTYTMSAVLQERATPTPTAELRSDALAMQANAGTETSADASTGASPDASSGEQLASENAAAADSASAAVQESAAANISQQQPVAPTLPSVATVAPSPFPVPTSSITEQQHVLIQNQYGVNARSEPSLSGAVQTIVPPDTRLPLLERTADQEWIRVAMEDGSEAWVAASVVTVVEPVVEPAAPAQQVAAAPPTATSFPAASASTAPATPTMDPLASAAASAEGEDSGTAGTDAVSDTAGREEAPPAAPTATPTSTPQRVTSAGVTGTGQSYTISLLNPEDGLTTGEDVTLRWSSGFSLAENQAFEPVVWRADALPLQDGVSLGAPMRGGPGEVMQIEAPLSSLESGEYRWGVLLVQQDPYQRLALMSGERTIFVE